MKDNITKLALTLPWKDGEFNTKITVDKISPKVDSNLGALVSGFANIAFMIGGFLMLFWLSWGVFQYIFAGGDKERLARARSRIAWALVGFIILVVMFFVGDYLKTIYTPKLPGGVTTVTEPPVRNSSSGRGSGGTGSSSDLCTQDIINDCKDNGGVCKMLNGEAVCVTSANSLCTDDVKNDCRDNGGKVCAVLNNEPVCVDP